MSPNNMIPYGHFHKKWQRRVKTWFNQPMKKKRRHLSRMRKIVKCAPKPVNLLRPIVHCPSVRYNSRVRTGHGFTLQELKLAKINPYFAQTIGIAVDYRRRNRSVETLQMNKERLVKYKSNLIMDIKKSQRGAFVREDLNKVDQPLIKFTSRIPTAEEKKFEAYITLRKARAQERTVGKKFKKNLSQAGDDGLTRVGKKKVRNDDD